ncbi:heme o synthase [Paenibacillus physcomitrellae]|uniref:Protoheme IX farnesyltransferase n=1 Tax=Paenibacillus physcomitrellae TaxID=1619311 RepID=A0ABQ1G0K5_9BACL|nr:heme o synthase [Paenibacillus physcomitrellae]GGA35140.1 protoheme IX farnesyltransferase 2 [Paenibacillus physcomitrellae]
MGKPLRYEAGRDSAALSVNSAPESESATWRDFVALTKPGIIRSNLIATFAGYWLGAHWHIDIVKLIITMIGTALVMAGACVFNNYYDREMDTKMERTQNRALPLGKLSPRTVLIYAGILSAVGLVLLFLFSGGLAGLFGIVGMLVYGVVYTIWLKRSSTWSTSIGAISGAMPPVIGYVAASGQVDLGAWMIFAILFLWQPPHFWALAIRRVEEYRAAGFPVLPVVKGVERTKIQMIPYIALLLPIPYLMYANDITGIWFLIIGTALSAIWLIMALVGFMKQDVEKWSKRVFIFSINYLTLSLIVMFLDTVHK